MDNKLNGIELLAALTLIPGPSGCEDMVAAYIKEYLSGIISGVRTDKLGNVIAHMEGEDSSRRLMVCAHMDEVGFMVTEIDDEGNLRFSPVGGIDPRVLCGRRVTIMSKDGSRRINGLISSKPIHLQNADERGKATKVDGMYIDIGADDGDMARHSVSIGDYGTFISDFYLMGENKMKGKAIDDRLGCAVMLDTITAFVREGKKPKYDTYFAFTVREEVGISGANTAAFEIKPDYALILESTAVADIADVPPEGRVAELGAGGVISLVDRATVYDHGFVTWALELAEKRSIAVQVKKFVSGGNDAGAIHRSRAGVKTLALSAPTRYLHTASTVADTRDYTAIAALVRAVCE
ncbi:MAG: M42 family metallopeptidase [Eubacteriales bacterium]